MAPGSGSPSDLARKIVDSVSAPPADVPKISHFTRLVGCQQHAPNGRHIFERRGKWKIRRHPIIDRDDAEFAVAGHHHAFAGTGLARKQNEAAAMNMHEQPVTIVRGDFRRGDDEHGDAGHRRRFDLKVEMFFDRRNVVGGPGRALEGEILPRRRVGRDDVPSGRILGSDDCLQFRAYRFGHGQLAGGELAWSEIIRTAADRGGFLGRHH